MLTLIVSFGFVLAARMAPAHDADASRAADDAIRIDASRAYHLALRDELVTSTDARTLALGATLIPTLDDDDLPLPTTEKDRLYRRAVALAPHDALVHWIVAQWQLGIRDDAQAAKTIAALTRIEPDNAATWALALSVTTKLGDDAGAETALARMAASSRDDAHMIDLLRAWMAIFDAHPPPSMLFEDASHPDLDSFAESMAYAASLVSPNYKTLLNVCKRSDSTSAQLIERCGAIGHLMADHSKWLVGRAIGRAVLRAIDDGYAATADAERREADWISMNLNRASGFDQKDVLMMQAYVDDWRHVNDELEIIRRALRRAGISESPAPDWNMPSFTVP